MACVILEITAEDCVVSDGGLKFSFITDSANIEPDGVVFDVDQVVTAAPTLTSGAFAIFESDTDDDTNYYNQVGERQNNKHVYNQTAFLKFAGIDKIKRKAAEALKSCCALVAVHFLNNGKAMIQGIELVGTDEWQTTKKKCKATINIMSDTGANEDRIEITLISQSRQASPLTTATKLDFMP